MPVNAPVVVHCPVGFVGGWQLLLSNPDICTVWRWLVSVGASSLMVIPTLTFTAVDRPLNSSISVWLDDNDPAVLRYRYTAPVR